MRVRAAALGGAAIVLAVALVGFFWPQPESPSMLEAADGRAPVARAAEEEPAADAPAPDASSAANVERAPLPGEALTTPMTQFLSDLRGGSVDVANAGSAQPLPPALVAGELEFAREAIDAAWAPGAEAGLLAKFAQMPGLELIDLHVECRSTMCRLQTTQPRAAPGEQAGPSFNALLESVGMKPRLIMAVVDGPFDSGSAPLRSFAYLWRDGVDSSSLAGREVYFLELPKPN